MCHHEFRRLHTEDRCVSRAAWTKSVKRYILNLDIFPNLKEIGGGCHVHIPKGHLPRGRLGASLPVFTQKTTHGTLNCLGVVVDG